MKMKKLIAVILATSVFVAPLQHGIADSNCDPSRDGEQCYRDGYDQGENEGLINGFVFGVITMGVVIWGVVSYLNYRDIRKGQDDQISESSLVSEFKPDENFSVSPIVNSNGRNADLGIKFRFSL